MCGITGFFAPNGSSRNDADVIRVMTDAVAHRGPDDKGWWIDPEHGIALGHRRLSIIDLSPLGHQPMESSSGRYVLTYNGEIYNYLELRQRLSQLTSPPAFRGNSDTEVMLAAFERWGIEQSLEWFVGMFAFALWDREHGQLYLARDRMGEKPLYYGWCGEQLLFGSELKALRQHPQWRGAINRNAVALLMQYSYIPAPFSIYQDIYKVPPATLLRFSPDKLKNPQAHEYWSLRDVCEAGYRNPFEGSEQEAVDQLDGLIRCSVEGQMISDVPLGAFLSGGIDSSTIVALMQAQNTRPVKTFSIGFLEAGYDEAPYAKAVASHLGTDHTELYVTAKEAQEVIPRLATIWDEPFADSSQIPTYLVSELARRHVTVSLSGDGGDELFGGYRRYLTLSQLNGSAGRMPFWLQSLAGRLPRKVTGIPAYLVEQATGRRSRSLRRLQNGLSELPFRPVQTYHRLPMSHWWEPTQLVMGSEKTATIFERSEEWASADGLLQRLTFLDMSFYLPNDILVKVDRAAMSVSLETRVPLLDHHVVAFSQRIPDSMKLRGGSGKWLLRQVLYRYVPRELIERPKMGFGVPIDQWLRTDLLDWAEDLLDSRRLREDGIFDVELVRNTWRQHLAGTVDNHYSLWDILVFQQWLASMACS